MTIQHADSKYWDQLEDALLDSGKRGPKAATRAPLSATFDAAELVDLQRIVSQTRLFRSRNAPIGNLVFLHGITGSDLAVSKANGPEDRVWINPLRLIGGRVADLRLDPGGAKESTPGVRVRPTGLNRRYYAKAVLSLRARWNVEPYAYDWRRDINEASDGLAKLLRTRFPNQPVHLVAHSLGGLVVRNFILRHPQLWETLRDAEMSAGGRLVMLGTPNYGSFSIPPVLAGTDHLIELLQRLDLKHNLPGLLDITNSFVGTYMLLPSPSKLSAGQLSLYQRETWGNVPSISQRHLDRTYHFYKDLENGVTVDPTRMIYVAGARYVTISSMNIVAPGEFEYKLGVMGDGRVPHDLGLLPGVPTYYVEEVHGDLARNEQVLRAVDQILLTGRTDELVTTALRGRAIGEPRMRDYRTAADRRLMAGLEQVAAKARAEGADKITEDDQRVAADALIGAALGTNAKASQRPATDAGTAFASAQPRTTIIPVALNVGVRFGDVTQIKAPIVVVGHYRGVEPVNAIGAIDEAMGHWITRAVKRGMISGQLGETFFVPSRGKVAADGVVIAGMGDYGQFNAVVLRRLMANVAIGAAALGLSRMSTVLIGAGEGAIDRDVALIEALEGIGAGLIELRDEIGSTVALKEVVLIEREPARFFLLLEKLKSMEADASLSNVRLTVIPALAGDQARGRKAEAAKHDALRSQRRRTGKDTSRRAFEEVRIAVERDAARDLFRFSALTKSAVVPVREVVVNLRNAHEAAQALRNASTPREQAQYGRLLYTYLIPNDFEELLDSTAPVRLIVDSTSAAYPWEMACFDGQNHGSTLRWLGTDSGLSRQFKSMISSPPSGFTPPLGRTLRVLVIADPAPEPELQLPGARTEGRRLVDALKGINGTSFGGTKVDIQVDHRIGPGECEPIEILALLLSGDYDIVHFSGHGDFDPKNPKMSGWLFGADRVLTAVDIFRARRVPRLVFANACFSGAMRESSPNDLTRGLCSIAEAFLERGVPNYIGTGWPVDDAQAVNMAHCFYNEVVKGSALGPALQGARKSVFKEGSGSTWGAYQLYGNPGDTLLRRGAA
jgi:pimeloyl-ACP methyl ester carboxylesterase